MRCGRRRCLRPHPLFEGALVRRPAPRGGSVPSRKGRCAGDDRCDARRPRRTGSMPWTAAAVEGRAGRTSRMSFAARQLSLRCSSASSVFCLPTVVRRAPSAPVARFCGWPVKPCFGRAFLDSLLLSGDVRLFPDSPFTAFVCLRIGQMASTEIVCMA